jgi:dihydroorotase
MVAHCYTGKRHGILEEGRVTPAVWGARERGVLFECAHGKSNFAYAVAAPAIEQGFLPDLVCSDTSYRNWNGPVFDLLTTMAKLVALGMELVDVIDRTTVAPASRLGLEAEGFGRIEVGAPARLSVFRQLDEPELLPDAAGGSRPVHRLEPAWTVIDGRSVRQLTSP